MTVRVLRGSELSQPVLQRSAKTTTADFPPYTQWRTLPLDYYTGKEFQHYQMSSL